MPQDDWLKLFLEQMQRDIDEIKKDVKTLQEAKSKADGAIMAVSALISIIIGMVAAYLKI